MAPSQRTAGWGGAREGRGSASTEGAMAGHGWPWRDRGTVVGRLLRRAPSEGTVADGSELRNAVIGAAVGAAKSAHL